MDEGSILTGFAQSGDRCGGDTVRGLYGVLLNTVKNGRALGQSGRFMQLPPVIHRSFDIASMVMR